MAAVSAALVGAGLVASAAGAYESYKGAQAQSQASQNISGLEIQQDAVRRQAMELSAKRQSMEVLRNQQRARSLAQNNATGQGAQFGSGLQGGYGQISGQSGVNLLGINQNKQLGETMFDLNGQINQQKIAMAQAGTTMALGQGISGLGSKLGGSAGPANNLFGGGGSSGGNMSYTDFGTGQGAWPMFN